MNQAAPYPHSCAGVKSVGSAVELGPSQDHCRSGTHRRSSRGHMHSELWPLCAVQHCPNLLEVQDTPDHSS